MQQANAVNRGEIRVKETPVALGERAGLRVLLEQHEDVRLEPPVRHQRCTLPKAHVPQEVLVVQDCIGQTRSGLPCIAECGPPCLTHDDRHI